MLTPKLSEALGQQIIIDNRGGAAGNIGAELAAKAPPDGYTIVFAYSGTHSINPHIYSKMPFRETDFAPIIWLASVPQVVVVHPSLPVKNIRELVALAKAKPGELSYGSSGNGAINHLAGELFNYMGRDSWGDYDLLFGAAQQRLRIREVPVHYGARLAGVSKMNSIKHTINLLKMCWHGFWQVKTLVGFPPISRPRSDDFARGGRC